MDQQYEAPVDDDQGQNAPEDVEEGGEPQMVRIKVNGRVLVVSEDVADAIQARETDFNRRMSEQGAELGRLRQQVQPQQTETAEDRDLRFFQSPSETIEEALAERDRRWQEALAFREAEQKYWNAFYVEHPKLAGRETIVQTVLQQNLQHLSSLPPVQSRKELADAVYELLSPVDAAPTTTTTRRATGGQVVTERASGAPAPTRRPKTTTDPEPYSGAAIINARRERFRQAMYRIPKE